MNIFRWMIFLPGGLLIGTMASMGGMLGSFWFPDVIRDIMCGLFGAVGTICGGLWIAPIKHPVVKWMMLILCFAVGILSVIGGFLDPDGAVKGVTIGLSVLVISGFYCFIPTHELINPDAPHA
jgi:hypothetical protein